MLDALTLPVRLTARAGALTLRSATPDDLDGIVALLADDAISASRGDFGGEADRPAYAAALEAVLATPTNALLVSTLDAETATGQRTAPNTPTDSVGRDTARAAAQHLEPIAGTMQLTRIPGMARKGASRLLVEAVRVRSDLRSGGIGGAMMRWVTDTAAPQLGAALVQLTSDSARVDAHRFYERLGFAQSHLGFKYKVS